MSVQIRARSIHPTGFLLAACFSTILVGCATLDSREHLESSFAIDRRLPTRLAAGLAASESRHLGQSGFALLDYGLEALLARVVAGDSADRTIDVQGYIYDHDEAGSLLTACLIRAADRGVRVRLLLDDFNFGGNRDLTALCAHPRIQIRLFNPASHRLPGTRLLQYAIHFRQLDRRMHDKLFIADNEITILGGRNNGDNYFNVGASKAFRDFDVLAAGPISVQASSTFDRFWNSPWSVPLPRVIGRTPSLADLEWLRHKIAMQSKSAGTFNSEYRGTRERYLSSFDSDHNALVWASGEIVSDPPEKVEATTPETTLVGQRFNEEWAKARSEILIEEAYFLPGPDGPRHFLGYRSTGATVRILTSGAETTDVPIVYGAYRGYRAGLLEEGVQLYEFRRQPARRLPQGLWYQVRPPYAALHSKVMVFDRKTVWIGTFNLDPRSVRLNTEIVAVIHSEQLSRQLAGAIVDDLSSKLSWRVRLAQGRVTLTGEVDGRLITLRHEPMSVWRALEAFLLPLIPEVRDQL